MSNKCPNCGYEYNDGDVFCAKCGTKLDFGVDIDNNDEIAKFEESKDKTIENMDSFSAESKQSLNNPFATYTPKNHADSAMFGFAISMIVICILLSFVLYVVIARQTSKKLNLRYLNLISHPQLIPQLKEPSDFSELKNNLGDVEGFLSLYLKYSKDSYEKKEQVFTNYLTEMDKLPHITNENVVFDDLDECSVIKSQAKARSCAKKISNDFKNVGIVAFSDFNTVILYPDYKFIDAKYSKYLQGDMKEYVKLRSKYNSPVNVGLNLHIKPKKLADRVYEFEKLYNATSNMFVKEELERLIYNDFRRLIFSPVIYATDTHEMAKSFRGAYVYYIRAKKDSELRPVLMSYLDKNKNYTEENFRNDYPYKLFNENEAVDIEKSALSDVFVILRKSIYSQGSETTMLYKYNITTSSWKKYDKNTPLTEAEYALSNVDENNNISVYNSAYVIIQELSVPKYSKPFIQNNSLYLYNSDRMSISKVIFSGSYFSVSSLYTSDISSIFPGINIINIDSYPDYNIYLEKDNAYASYIIVSKYSHGYSNYTVTPVSGTIKVLNLPNMFSVSSEKDVVLSFHDNRIPPEETSDSAPTYKITIRTKGYENSVDYQRSKDSTGFIRYDEKTAHEQNDKSDYKPNMMPKIINKDNSTNIDAPLQTAPKQKLEPPEEEAE